MKKILFIISLSLFVVIQLNAQTNTFPTSGNVGIGTTSPYEKLHINGLIRLEQATNQDNDSPGIVLVSNDDFLYDGKYLNQYGFGFHDFEDPTNASIQRPNPYISGYYGIDLFSRGQNRMRISYGGNIGIGTTSPISKLDLNYGSGSSTIPGMRISGGGAVYDNIALSLDDTGTAANNVNILEFKNSSFRSAIIKSINPASNNSSGGNLVLETTSSYNGTLNTDQLVLKNNGNIGIGTYDPHYKLSVADGVFNVEKNGDYYGFWVEDKLRTDNPKINLGAWYNNRAGISYNSSGKYLTFDTQNTTTTFSNTLVLKDGNVGIGTTNPGYSLDVHGATNGMIRAYGSNIGRLSLQNSFRHYSMSVQNSKLFFFDETGGAPRMSIISNGNIGIGTSNPDAKLAVKGNIHTNEVKVDLLGAVAPDYVFYKDYHLKTLIEVENYISKEGHLPNIPSAKEMEKEGIKLKEMNLKLLEKIEELTLYTIQQEKALKSQKKEIKASKNEITILKEKASKIDELENNLQKQKNINKNLEDKLKAQETRLQKIEALLNSIKQ